MQMTSILKPASALGLAAIMTFATVDSASARRGHWVAPFVAGAAIATILGSRAYAQPYYYGGCYKGPVQCRFVGGGCWANQWGERVCRRGQEQCWRPTICE